LGVAKSVAITISDERVGTVEVNLLTVTDPVSI
jgi:hypothetical protein